jgi:zinc protease
MDSSTSPDLDRNVPPVPGSVRPFHLPPVRAEELENGFRLRSLPQGRVPLVSACVVLDAGETQADPDLGGVAVLTGDALQGGTERRSASELAEALERLGSGVQVSTGWDATTLAFTCVAERMEALLAILSEMLRAPGFPPGEVERIRHQRLAAIRQRRMQPGPIAGDALDHAVFGPEHPYHRPLAGDERSVGSLDASTVRDFAEARYGPKGAGIVLVGDLAEDQIQEAAQRHFGDWSGPAEPPRETAAPAPVRSGTVTLVHRPGAPQSELRIGQEGPARGHPDEMALRVANAVLGGTFTSRLNLSLRERHGYTYGVHSRFSFRRSGGAFTISTAVETKVTSAALAEAMSVFRRFSESGPEGEELERVREYLAGIFPLRMETTAQLAARLAELLVFDLPDDHHHRYRERVRSVDVDLARDAVRRHLHPQRAAVVVVGDAEVLAPELEGLGLGPITVRDP